MILVCAEVPSLEVGAIIKKNLKLGDTLYFFIENRVLLIIFKIVNEYETLTLEVFEYGFNSFGSLDEFGTMSGIVGILLKYLTFNKNFFHEWVSGQG